MKIVTRFIFPPVPFRSHDWCAYDDDLEDGAPDSTRSPTGYGVTKSEALLDLIPELIEHYQTVAYAEGRKDQAEDDARREFERAGAALDANPLYMALKESMARMAETGQRQTRE